MDATSKAEEMSTLAAAVGYPVPAADVAADAVLEELPELAECPACHGDGRVEAEAGHPWPVIEREALQLGIDPTALHEARMCGTCSGHGRLRVDEVPEELRGELVEAG